MRLERRLKRTNLTQGRSPFIHPVRRLREYLRAVWFIVVETRDRAETLEALSAEQLRHLEKLSAGTGVEATTSSRDAQHEQLVEIMRSILEDSRWRRRRLQELRASGAYEQAYSESDPLVSVVIPTYDNYELLRERAIPSVLAQTYQNFEIVVVGDAAPDDARAAVESFADPRITFHNRLYRGPYPKEPQKRWLVAGVPAYNEAVRRASGLWIAPLDDDDAFRPQHIERVLTRAREQRLELCYGRMCGHLPDGSTTSYGRFPPEEGEFGLQMAVYHAGLAEIFELELTDAPLGLPYDQAFWMRMMEADVRMGMVDEVTADYYPSRYWTPRWQEDSP